jgi:hypothetical protein
VLLEAVCGGVHVGRLHSCPTLRTHGRHSNASSATLISTMTTLALSTPVVAASIAVGTVFFVVLLVVLKSKRPRNPGT